MAPGDTDADGSVNRPEAGRRLTAQTRSSCVLLSPRDTLALPRQPYAASVASSSPSDAPRTPSIRVSDHDDDDDDDDGEDYPMMDPPSPCHSRSGSTSSDADAEVFGLKAITREDGGVYMTAGSTRNSGGWLIMGDSSSEQSSREDLRESGLQPPPKWPP